MWHTGGMTPDEARAELRRIANARDREPQAVMDAVRAGVPQKDIAADLGRTREHIRRIVRTAEAEETNRG